MVYPLITSFEEAIALSTQVREEHAFVIGSAAGVAAMGS